MFLKIMGDVKPDYIVICFDRPKPTFRKQMYVGYQAHRPTMESDLVPQIKLVREALIKANVQIFEVDGYEADDLIGTISKQSVKADKDLQVIIVSGDRDLLQLVNHNVLMMAPITGITKMILFDEEKVKEKYGLNPHQFIDYKALVGDSSDNYPGVGGIGPKTAANLLNKYETFENIYRNLGELPENLALKLAQDAEQAAMAKKLATIEINAPIKIKLGDCSSNKIDRKKLLEFFRKMGFSSLLSRLGEEEVKIQKVEKEQKKEDKVKVKSDQLGLL
jgi:DNA polymerase-1